MIGICLFSGELSRENLTINSPKNQPDIYIFEIEGKAGFFYKSQEDSLQSGRNLPT
jgi:hypothetical protein